MWTYTAGTTPENLDRDTVRFYAGDTRAEDPLVQDEEIALALSVHPEPRLAAALVCESLSAIYARLVDVSVGAKRTSLSGLSERFALRAKTLRENEETATGSGSGAVIAPGYTAGISYAEYVIDWENEDLVIPPFGIVGDDQPPFLAYLEGEQTE